VDAAPINLGGFDKEHDDARKIGDGLWVPCRICEEVFLRVRLTARYCNTCKRGFCEGEHGNFAGRGVAVCVQCHRPSTRKAG
jgi:hypothetical protein